MSQQDPMDQLRRANPAPLDSTQTRPDRNKLRLTGQVLLAVAGIFVVGAGAAWAASGTNLVASLFGDDIEVTDSTYGLSSISTLEPATQERFEDLPSDVAFRAMTVAVRKTIMANLRDDRPPFYERGPSRTEDFDPIPAEISAIGQGTTFSNTRVSMMVIEGEICTYFGVRGASACGTLADVEQGLVEGSRDPGTEGGSRIFGVVTDDVAFVQIVGSGHPPEPVSSNSFDLRNVRPEYPVLVALDANENELFSCSNSNRPISERKLDFPIDCR